MREVTKKEFKDVYFKLGGGAETGWGESYWNGSFEKPEAEDMKYFLEEPASPKHTRMYITTDHGQKQHRMFFLTDDEEDSICKFPDET